MGERLGAYAWVAVWPGGYRFHKGVIVVYVGPPWAFIGFCISF